MEQAAPRIARGPADRAHALPQTRCATDSGTPYVVVHFGQTPTTMMLRKLLAICATAFLVAISTAYATPAQVQALHQVNRDIWGPFVRGVGSFDDATWLGVRSKDFVMVQQGKPHFLDHDFYVEDSTKVMRALKQAGTRLAVEVRFDERMTDGRYGSERGLIRTTVSESGKEARTIFSRFHAIVRLEDGRWRVLTEYRTPAGPGAEQAFSAAHGVDAVAEALKE